MRILFVCRFLPHPQVRDSGGQDTYHYVAALSEQHAVSLVAFVSDGQEKAVAEMREICEEVVGVGYRHHALLPRLWRAWWRVWMPRVYGRVFSLSYRAALRGLLARSRFDVVIVDGMMAQYGKLVRGAKRVLDEVDIYSGVAHHLFRAERRPLHRLLAQFDWLRTLVFELNYAMSYDGILVRSPKDRTILQDLLPRQRFAVIAPWFEGLDELQTVALRRPPGNDLLYVGAMDLPANIAAVQFFARRVLPLVQQKVRDVRFYVVGASPSVDVIRLGDEGRGVIVTGEVPSLKPYYEKCAVGVVPLLTGGGVIVKTLNSMAAGRPTVTTVMGNSGTGAKAGRDLLVVNDTPFVFAEAVVRLLVDDGQWRKFAAGGRQFVTRNYDWASTMQNLAGFLVSVAEDDRY